VRHFSFFSIGLLGGILGAFFITPVNANDLSPSSEVLKFDGPGSVRSDGGVNGAEPDSPEPKGSDSASGANLNPDTMVLPHKLPALLPRLVFEVQHVRGEIWLSSAHQKKRRLVSDQSVAVGGEVNSIELRLGQQSSVRLVRAGMKLDLVSNSTLRLDSNTSTKRLKMGLLYGSVRVVLNHEKGKQATDSLEIRVPNGRIVAKVDAQEKTHFLVHVMRNEQEFQERLALATFQSPSRDKNRPLAATANVFCETECLSGKVSVFPAIGESLSLVANDIARILGKSSNYAPTRVSASELSATVHALGLSVSD